MRIVSLNTWKNEGDYSRRLPLMRDGLAAMAPDVVCLQECFVADGFDTAAWLAAELGLNLHSAPARSKPRWHEGRNRLSTSGLAILARGTATAATQALSSVPDDEDRIAQSLDLLIEARPLRVLNRHLTHLRNAAQLRATQFTEALDWAVADLEGGLVVAGDLNAGAEDPALAPLRLQPKPSTLHGARLGLESVGSTAIDHCVLMHPGLWQQVAPLRGCDAPDAEGWFPSDHAAVGMVLA